MTYPLILASASPRRRALLEREGIPFTVFSCPVDELTHADGIPGAEVSLLNARRKLDAVLSRLGSASEARPPFRVLTADTEVVLDDRALGKPSTPEDAFAMLCALSGRTHHVLTAFVLAEEPTGRRIERVVCSSVTFRTLSREEIEAYLATGEPYDKAGAYGIQGRGGALVARLDGSFDNVVGLPVAEVCQALGALDEEPSAQPVVSRSSTECGATSSGSA